VRLSLYLFHQSTGRPPSRDLATQHWWWSKVGMCTTIKPESARHSSKRQASEKQQLVSTSNSLQSCCYCCIGPGLADPRTGEPIFVKHSLPHYCNDIQGRNRQIKTSICSVHVEMPPIYPQSPITPPQLCLAAAAHAPLQGGGNPQQPVDWVLQHWQQQQQLARLKMRSTWYFGCSPAVGATKARSITYDNPQGGQAASSMQGNCIIHASRCPPAVIN